MDFSLAPRAKGPASWIETLLVSALALGLGLWLTPDDPLQLRGDFPWPLLAPLLIGVRYGFVRGLVSACLVVMTFLSCANKAGRYTPTFRRHSLSAFWCARW